MSVIVENISYVYSKGTPFEHLAIKDMNFEIKQGEFVAIIGHTGSGKSTLIQHLNGLIKPTSGRVLTFGFDTKDKKTILDVRRNIGLVFQYPEYQLFEDTIAKDIAFGCKNLKMSKEEQIESVKYAMDLVDLDYETYKDVSPFELSGGQKRRVAIAGVLAMRPKTIILDEPTSGLDPQSTREILDMIKKMAKSGITIIMVSHDMDHVYENATRVIVVNDGKIVFDDTPSNVFAHAKELVEIGLDVPSGCRFAYMLREKGINIDDDVMDIDALAENIKRLAGAKNE